jgi:hypothetical protein
MAESFFLEPDDAKSLGNIDYMRTARKVKKSFPTTKAWGAGFEEESSTSAMAKDSANAQPTVTPEVKISPETQQEIAQRRRGASDLDMFRNMAKDMRRS